MTDIVDTHSKEAFSGMQLQQALLDEQALIAKELLGESRRYPASLQP